MMNFELNENQTMFRDMVRDFAQKEIAPLAHEMDVNGDMPEELIAKMRDNGFFGLTFPEQYGGLGVDTLTYGLVVEELSKASAGVSVMLTVHNSVGSYPVALFGSEEVKEKYLPRMAAGEIAAFCVTEPGAGSDAGSLITTARKEGDSYFLNGSKCFVTNGSRAAFFVVVAREPGTSGNRGTHAFIVEGDSPGLSVAKKEDKMGLRASDTVTIDFTEVEVPAGNRLGDEGDGLRVALTSLDGGRIGIAFQALGIGEACLHEAINYAKVREQFGKPISQQPTIGNMIADMGTSLAGARMLSYYACWLKDSGQSFTKEAAMAKLCASEAAWQAADSAVQIHGGYGFCKEYAVERYYRDVRVTRIYEGTSEIQRLVIARKLMAEH
ncbi:MAG: alkylation response protein AidB-like acyl-CoA dehydrogenase [Candidatus Krumholzibacteriia bacterium]|jgi:alkylation response protein AidB-like acyl-CoA dehydrogenase